MLESILIVIGKPTFPVNNPRLHLVALAKTLADPAALIGNEYPRVRSHRHAI